MGLNLLGNLSHCRVFGEVMVSAGDGSIANVPLTAAGALTSVVGYSAAKVDVENLTRWLAVKLARRATARGCGSTPQLPGSFSASRTAPSPCGRIGLRRHARAVEVDHRSHSGRFGEPEQPVGITL
jgi:NAD(P)-dependent dehydrogenase (short-subunit alcohol dehydrogenase family)